MSSASSGGEAIADIAPNHDQGELVPEPSSGSDESSHFVSEDDPLYQLRPQLTTEASIDPAQRKSVTSGTSKRKRNAKRESSSGSEYQPPDPKKKKRTKKIKVQARKEYNGGDSSEQAEKGEEDDSADEADPQDEVAFGETAGGVEAATVQQAAVEALDESSSDVELEPKEMKVRRKSRKLRRWKTTRIGMVDRKEWMLLSNLKKLPSALKQETDRLRGDKNDQVTYLQQGMILWQHLEKVKKWLGEGRKEEAATLLQEILKRPDDFWRGDFHVDQKTLKRVLRTDDTYGAGFCQPTFAFEEVGVLVLDMAQQLGDREARLKMIQQVAVEAKKWRARLNKAAIHLNRYLKKTPRTLIRCAELLLEEGDVKGLNSMFEGWSPNTSNEEAETPLLVLRSVATMLERKGRDEGDSLSMSGLSFTSLASTSRASSGGRGDATMNHMTRVMLGPRGVEVAWTVRLVAWYVMEERNADDVLDLLIKYRDQHTNHVACHTPLLEFLDREYSDEFELRQKHLVIAADQFPWHPCVLDLCKLMGLSREERGEVESFDSGSEDRGSNDSFSDAEKINITADNDLSPLAVKKADAQSIEEDGQTWGRANKEGEKKDDDPMLARLDSVRRLLLFLEYDVNCQCKDAWGLLVEKLRTLVLAGKADKVEEVWGEQRDFWWTQNYSSLAREEASLVRDKGSVAVVLAGTTSPSFLKTVEELERRRADGVSGVTVMIGELEAYKVRNLQPCIKPTKKTRLDQRFLVNEWKVIEDLNRFKYSATARKNPEFPNC